MRDLVRTLSVDGHLGVRHDNTIDSLKKQLGVDQLQLVVVESIDEYRGLLTEKTEPNHRRRWIVLSVLALILFMGVSMWLHPGIRLDRLANHLDVQVH